MRIIYFPNLFTEIDRNSLSTANLCLIEICITRLEQIRTHYNKPGAKNVHYADSLWNNLGGIKIHNLVALRRYRTTIHDARGI